MKMLMIMRKKHLPCHYIAIETSDKVSKPKKMLNCPQFPTGQNQMSGNPDRLGHRWCLGRVCCDVCGRKNLSEMFSVFPVLRNRGVGLGRLSNDM